MNDMKKLMETLDRINEESSYDENEALIDEMETFLEETKYKIQEFKNALSSHLGYDSPTFGRARYWISSIESALDDESEWMGGPMYKMQNTIDELRDDHESEMDREPVGEYDDDDMGELASTREGIEEDFEDFDFDSTQDFIDYIAETGARKFGLEVEDQSESNGEYEMVVLNPEAMTISTIVLSESLAFDGVHFEMMRAGSGDLLDSHYFERADKATADQILDLMRMPMENTIGRRPY